MTLGAGEGTQGSVLDFEQDLIGPLMSPIQVLTGII